MILTKNDNLFLKNDNLKKRNWIYIIKKSNWVKFIEKKKVKKDMGPWWISTIGYDPWDLGTQIM